MYTQVSNHIYIYTHAVHCTIVIENCGPVTLMGKRGVVHFFFFVVSSVFLFSLFRTLWEKKISVLPDQNCCTVATLQNVHASHVGMKKKSTKFIVCLASLCVKIRIKTKNCEK